MLPVKRILWFFVRFLVIYGLLIAPWPGVNAANAALLRGVGNAIFSIVGISEKVHLHPLDLSPEDIGLLSAKKPTLQPDEDRSLKGRPLGFVPQNPDIRAHLMRNENEALGDMTINSRFLSYFPFITWLALALATPLPWPRRTRAMLWGLLMMTGFILLRLGVKILHAFVDGGAIAESYPVVTSLMWRLDTVIAHSSTSWFLFSVLIWGLATFGRGEGTLLLFGQRGVPEVKADPSHENEPAAEKGSAVLEGLSTPTHQEDRSASTRSQGDAS